MKSKSYAARRADYPACQARGFQEATQICAEHSNMKPVELLPKSATYL
jgi:hypothetical protein